VRWALDTRVPLSALASDAMLRKWWCRFSDRVQFALLIAGMQRPSFRRFRHFVAALCQRALGSKLTWAALASVVLALDRKALAMHLPGSWTRRKLAATLGQAASYDQWRAISRRLAEYDKGKTPKPSCPTPARPHDTAMSELDYGLALFSELRGGAELSQGLIGDMVAALRAGLSSAASFVSDCALNENDDEDADRTLLRLKDACHAVCFSSPDVPGWTVRERALLFREVQQVAGTYALALSGGGILGVFHTGVALTLLQHGLLPRVVSGSSAGSIVAAVVCTRTDEELLKFFDGWPDASSPLTQVFIAFFGPTPTIERMRNLLFGTGFMLPVTGLRQNLRWLLGDTTFAEAHAHSGRILNVSISGTRPGEQPRLLNYLSAGDVVVWTAVAASCSFPGLYAPQSLIAKRANGRLVPWLSPGAPLPDLVTSVAASGSYLERRFRDGSVDADIPRHALGQLFNVTRIVVSQVNPYLWLPLRLRALPFTAKAAAMVENEMRHWYDLSTLALTSVAEMTGFRFRFFNLARDLLHTIKQPWTGDVTIARAPSIRDVALSVSNPKPRDLAVYYRSGQQATWAQLERLRSLLSSLQTIEASTRELQCQLRAKRRRRQLGESGLREWSASDSEASLGRVGSGQSDASLQ
jgi:predicted acylesterase/phospholipase RssA